MSSLYIIAGPPGIGKSTNGSDYILNYAGEILNHDKLLLYYKNKGIIDYADISNLRANEFIKEQLTLHNDFGIELNLGYDTHYDFIRYVRKNFPNYLINITMFFTDDVQLCIDRTIFRKESGGHHVETRIVREMYNNTIPLLRENIRIVNQLQFVNVDAISIEMVYEGYYPSHKHRFIDINLPKWLIDNFPEIKKK
jgi:predicted ABC-type ATPase